MLCGSSCDNVMPAMCTRSTASEMTSDPIPVLMVGNGLLFVNCSSAMFTPPPVALYATSISYVLPGSIGLKKSQTLPLVTMAAESAAALA